LSDNTVQRKSRNGFGAAIITTISASAIAALLGAGAGVVMAQVAPGNKFSWAGLAIVPLWFLLDVVFELIVGVFGSYSRFARIAVTSALLLGFYIAWFTVRTL
jgi:hypothetical protein